MLQSVSGDGKQIHACDHGNDLAGIGVSFAEDRGRCGRGTRADLYERIGCMGNRYKESRCRNGPWAAPFGKVDKKRPAGAGLGHYFYFIDSLEMIGQVFWIILHLE